ncbi:MAG: chemotaxis protein CheW [Acidobacteria bacterium]|nr:chemotaxis protein CheW [Acidobacteriota bacterium]
MTTATPSGTAQYATFYLDGLYLGIEVLSVQEVIRHQPLTPVPLAPPVVRGLINLRGQIVTAVDLRARLGLPPQPDDALPMNVVVRTTDGVVSLLVDEIDDVVEVHAGQFESPPDTIRRRLDTLVTGVYKLPRKLLLILDVERTVACGASTHVS